MATPVELIQKIYKKPNQLYREPPAWTQSFYRSRHELVTELAKRTADSMEGSPLRVLDLGCGGGQVLSALQEESRFELHGCDLVPENIERLKATLPQAKLWVQDLNQPLQTEQKFDLILSLVVTDYVNDLYLHLQEVRKHLAPQGVFIVHVGNLAYLKRRLLLLLGKYPSMTAYPRESWQKTGYDDGAMVNHFTAESLKYVLKRSGLEPFDTHCSGYFSRIRSIYPSLLGSDMTMLCRAIPQD